MKTRSLKWFVFAIASPMSLAAGISHAQPAASRDVPQVTRASILREIQELEAVGYNPSTPGDSRYPEDLQQALQKLDAKHRAEAATANGTAAETIKPEQATVAR